MSIRLTPSLFTRNGSSIRLCAYFMPHNFLHQVSGLDRSWQRPPGVKAKLIDSKAANGNPLLFWLHSSSLTMMVIVQPRKWRCLEFCSVVPSKTPSSTSLRKLKACRSLRVDCIYTLVTICSTYLPGLYYIDYTLQNPGETLRHLFTVLGMATTGWYNRLYTVTGQVSVSKRNAHMQFRYLLII